jgi:integrase
VAEQCIERHAPGWRRSDTHAKRWRASLQSFVHPTIGKLAVADVRQEHIIKILLPLWHAKPSTAARVRYRIEKIIDFAIASGWRDTANPASWGQLRYLLPRQPRSEKHHAALAWKEMPAFIAALRQDPSDVARLMELIILCANRSGEARLARWSEVDLDQKIWTLPGERMKTGKLHRVPLSAAAVAVLRGQARPGQPPDDLIFQGRRRGHPFNQLTLFHLLRRIGYAHVTTHGFRSSFRDWCADCTSYPREIAEQALGHEVGSKVERAYRRSDVFQKRIALMQDWADYCTRRASPRGEIVVLRPAG